MEAVTSAVAPSGKPVWAGRILSGIVVLFLVGASSMGIVKAAEMAPQFARMGYPESLVIKIPVVCIICALIYAFPRTAILGAILLTGYLGGASATHIRIGEPFFFPTVVAVLAWGGVFLRDERLRALVPLRRA
jgi:DoxX-like protein